jgi:N-acetylglutamate synthase/N-acetylornithine aminotransferase
MPLPSTGRCARQASPGTVTVMNLIKRLRAALTIWTTDLSHAYVHENSAYSS